MKAIAIVVVLLITGCTVNGYELEKARNSCKDHGGVHSLHYGPHKPYAVCIDGEQK